MDYPVRLSAVTRAKSYENADRAPMRSIDLCKASGPHTGALPS